MALTTTEQKVVLIEDETQDQVVEGAGEQAILSSEEAIHLTTVNEPVVLEVQEQGAIGPIGPAGPPGSDGIDGTSGDSTYVHSQLEPSAQWIINHPLGKKPAVTIVDSADSVQEGDISYGNGQVIIDFDVPFGGKAYLN